MDDKKTRKIVDDMCKLVMEGYELEPDLDKRLVVILLKALAYRLCHEAIPANNPAK